MTKLMPFRDFVEINPKVELKRGLEYPFIEMAIVTPGRRYIRTDEKRVYSGGGSKFSPRDILFARITPCLENGKICQFIDENNQNGFGSTEFFIFRAKPGISDPAFVYYLVSTETIRKPAEKSMSGASGRQRADLSSIQDIMIDVYPLPIQRKIAAILSAYDDLIENNTRRIKILEEMAQAIYREWFVHFRFPGHEGVRMVESELGLIPEGWEVSKIDKVCSRIASGGTPTRNNENYWTPGTITWYKTKELQDSFLFDSEEKISNDGLTNSSAKIFPKDSIVIALYASPTLGRLGILTQDSTFNQAMCGLIANEKLINNYYLFFSLLNNRAYFQRIALGAAQQNINVTKLRSMPIIIPNKELIDEFQKIIDTIYLDIKNLLMKNINLRRTRDLLLPKLISGELDVSELDITIPEENT